MGQGKSSHEILLAPVPDIVDAREGAAPGPTAFERVQLTLGAAWRRKWIAAAVLLVGLDASVAYYRLQPPMYRAEAVLAQRQAPPPARPEVSPRAPDRSPRDLVHARESLLALIGEANLLAPSRVQPGSGDLRERLRRVMPDLNRDSAEGSDPTAALVRRLDDALEVRAHDGVVTVAVEWPDPEQAQRIVSVALKRLVEARRAQATGTLDEVVRLPEVPKAPASPNPIRVIGIGALVSLLLAVAVAAALELRAGRVAASRRAESARLPRAGGRPNGPASRVAIERGAERRAGSASQEFQELWFAVARRHWRSLVLVPADEGESVASIAASLSEVGRRLRRGPVTFFIISDPIDYGSAARLIAAFESAPQGGSSELAPASTGQVIVAIQPVTAEPLGLAATEAADVAVVCTEVGHTRLSAARRTIELIGRGRVAGCLVVHPTSASSTKRPARSTASAGAANREIQQMWLSLMREDWSSIVVVPTDDGIPARDVVAVLIEAAALHDVERFQVIDAVGASPAAGEHLAEQMNSVVASGSRAVAAVDSLMQSLSGVPLVRDAEVALLVVRLGQSSFEYVQSTIDIVGRERILGAVTLPS